MERMAEGQRALRQGREDGVEDGGFEVGRLETDRDGGCVRVVTVD